MSSFEENKDERFIINFMKLIFKRQSSKFYKINENISFFRKKNIIEKISFQDKLYDFKNNSYVAYKKSNHISFGKIIR